MKRVTHLAIVLLTVTTVNAAPAPLRSCAGIMPLGDSITIGTNGGYRNDLYTGLKNLHCAVDFVGSQSDVNTRVSDKHHEGHGGLTIGDIAREVQPWLTTSQPRIILVMIGTNDTAWWTNEDGAQIGARHDALISQLRAARPDAWIFVASIPPQSPKMIHGKPNGDNVDRAVLTQRFNAVIRANATVRAAAGQPVRFVDVQSALSTADLSADGVHPSASGYAKIAQAFLASMRVEFDARASN